MSIENFRQKFRVYIVDEEQSSRELIKECLSKSGYNVDTFSSADLAYAHLHSNPPHVIITTDFLNGMSGMDFMHSVQNLSKEIQFIFLEQNRDISMSLEMLRSGAYGVIRKPIGHIPEIIVTVDRSIEKVFMNLKNEQLIAELARKDDVINVLNEKLQSQQGLTRVPLDINEFTKVIKGARDTQAVLTFFLESINALTELPILYFRNAMSYNSIVYSQSAGFEETEEYKNLGINFKELGDKSYPQCLKSPENIDSLAKLLRTVFQTNDFEATALIVENEVHGLVIVLGKPKEPQIIRLFKAAFEVLQFKIENIELRKQLHDSLTKDKVTGLYDKRSFWTRLTEEMSRTRRLQHPIALISANIDHIKEYSEHNGASGTQLLMRMVANLLKKCSRKSDIICHFGEGRFGILLPDTDYLGASIKAEKLRRVIESAQFPNRHLQPMAMVTMSLGVSDYPNLSVDTDSLIQTTETALEQISKEIFNRVCVAKEVNNQLSNQDLQI